MYLTEKEKAMLAGAEGPVVAEAMDYIIQLGEVFDAERLVDITYCHYPAEMGIYTGQVEELVEYAQRGGRVRVPTTSTTLCADLERPLSTGIPPELAELQSKVDDSGRDRVSRQLLVHGRCGHVYGRDRRGRQPQQRHGPQEPDPDLQRNQGVFRRLYRAHDAG